MIQLYIVYRLFLYRQKNIWVVALITICWLLQAFCDPEGETLNRLRYNFIGGMLPFGLGILFARVSNKENSSFLTRNWQFLTEKLWFWWFIAVASVILTFVMCYSFQAWFWIPVVIITGCIAMVKVMPKWMLSIATWIGSISAAMFVAHPIARKLFITVAWKQDIYDGLMLYIIAVIALSWAVKQLIERIPKPKL